MTKVYRRTEGNKVVNFDRLDENLDLSGRIVTVRIDAAQTWSLNGTLEKIKKKRR